MQYFTGVPDRGLASQANRETKTAIPQGVSSVTGTGSTLTAAGVSSDGSGGLGSTACTSPDVFAADAASRHGHGRAERRVRVSLRLPVP